MQSSPSCGIGCSFLGMVPPSPAALLAEGTEKKKKKILHLESKEMQMQPCLWFELRGRNSTHLCLECLILQLSFRGCRGEQKG